MGEFCSLPPITLKPRPSSVLGSSTTRGWEWPSLAAKAATVACVGQQNLFSATCCFIMFFSRMFIVVVIIMLLQHWLILH